MLLNPKSRRSVKRAKSAPTSATESKATSRALTSAGAACRRARARQTGLWIAPVVLLLAGLPFLAGCRNNAASAGGGSASSGDSSVIATVNGTPITVGQMFDVMQRSTVQQVAQTMSTIPQAANQNNQIGNAVLFSLIQQELIVQLAANDKVPVTDQEITQRYNDLETQNSGQTTWPYDKVLAQAGLTPDAFKSEMLRVEVANQNLLTRNISVTPAEVLASYNSNKSKLYTEPHAVHIERVQVATKDAADQIYAAAKKDTPLASFQSQNQAPPTPGDDPVDIPQWLPLFDDQKADGPQEQAMGKITNHFVSAKAGDVLAPFQVGPAWWVVKVIAVRPRTTLPFDQVQDLVRTNIVEQKITPDDRANALKDLQTFEQSAALTVTNPSYNPLVQAIKNPTPPVEPGGMPVSAPPPAPAK